MTKKIRRSIDFSLEDLEWVSRVVEKRKQKDPTFSRNLLIAEAIEALREKIEGESEDEKMIEEFFSYPTVRVPRDPQIGYTVHLPSLDGEGAGLFPSHAVVEDMDGRYHMVDIGDNAEYEDTDDFIGLVVEKYEGRKNY